MWIKKFWASLLVITFVFGWQFPVFAETVEPDLILTTLDSHLSLDQQKYFDSEKTTRRSQPVNVQFDSLKNLETVVETQPVRAAFQLFLDLTLIAQFDQVLTSSTGTKIFSGNINNNPHNYIHLVETAGIISADIVHENIKYQLRQKNGDYFFVEIDQTQFPQEAAPIEQAFDIHQNNLSAHILLDETTYDSNAMVDVLVVYTEEARLAQGGTAAIENLINLAVAETNSGYANSGINHRMRLVHTEQVAYPEIGFDWSIALSQLRSSSDGILDHVHDLRNAYGADLVIMIVANAQYCGIAYLLPVNSDYYQYLGFSIVSDGCATGYYSFGHETGHNMGAHHDRANASSSGLFPYSYGYQSPDQTFRTIMAYNCAMGCIRINRWSNPDQLYNNIPLGIDASDPNSADNRLTLNNSANAVANFRQEVNVLSPTNLFAPEIHSFYVSLSFSDTNEIEEGFRIERSTNGNDWTLVVNLSKNITSYTDYSTTCETPYAYRVFAYSDQLESDPSNIINITTGECVAPDAPLQGSAIPTLDSITLNWIDTIGEINYLIQQSPDGVNNWQNIQILSQNSTTTTVSNLAKETIYYFRIAAENEYGITYTTTITAKTHSQAVYLPLTQK